MLEINQKTENKLDSLFKIILIVLILFFYKVNIVSGDNNNWIEISKTSTGIQYIDNDSIQKEEKGVIEIASKYLKVDAKTSKVIEENIYIMDINCLTSKFKDISVNGKKNLTAKWEDPNGDTLINDVISNSCKNV